MATEEIQLYDNSIQGPSSSRVNDAALIAPASTVQLVPMPPSAQPKLSTSASTPFGSKLNDNQDSKPFVPATLLPSMMPAASDEQIAQLLQALNAKFFSDEKFGIVQSFVSQCSISCAQAKLLLDHFQISFEKKTLITNTLKSCLNDPLNFERILETFDFHLDRLNVKQALGFERPFFVLPNKQ